MSQSGLPGPSLAGAGEESLKLPVEFVGSRGQYGPEESLVVFTDSSGETLVTYEHGASSESFAAAPEAAAARRQTASPSQEAREFQPLLEQTTARLRQVDARHFEVTLQDQRLRRFEVPPQAPPGPARRARLVEAQDRNGNRLTWRWDARGERVLSARSSSGQSLTCDWPAGWPGPRRVTDHAGRTWRYTWERVGRGARVLRRVEEPGGRVLEHTWRVVAQDPSLVANLLTTRVNGRLLSKRVQTDPYTGRLLEVTASSGLRVRP